MIYYSYELRWKNYKSLDSLEKEKKSEFELQYNIIFLNSLNDELYYEYLKQGEYVIQVIKITDSEIKLCIAIDIKAVNGLAYEKKILETFADCEIIRKVEITIGEYKRELQCCEVPHKNYGSLAEKLDIKLYQYPPLPFDMEEQVLAPQKISRSTCKKRAKEILGSKSLYEEIDRIYSKENQKIYLGHPVHYFISAGDWGAAKDIYELIHGALINNKRLLSNRLTLIRNIGKETYKDDRYAQIINAAEGGVVIIELKSEDAMGRFATDFHEFTKLTGNLMEQRKKDTLFIFVEIMGKSMKDNDALNNILTKADIIQITEGAGTLDEAKKYLMELVEKADFQSEDENDAIEFLPQSESYSVTDIFKAYNAWYGSGLKNLVYKAYKEKKSFKVEITRVERKPYEEIQAMIGLTEVKRVIDQIIAASKVLSVRERMGLNTERASLHMMFSGNPGTAKTTVARLLAKILKDEDAIASGKFVECGRQDLVGKYVGWTAHIVEQKFKEAMGGILFIDEAYALVDDSNTYGAEAINCITQMMENYRNDVIVIFAGYPKRMTEFIEQNEGLKSRIAFHLDFPDYSSDELMDILRLMSEKREYTIEEDALLFCREIFAEAIGEENFGNGRYVRNVLEQAILRQSSRIITDFVGEELSKEDMCCLKKDDFKAPSKCKKKNLDTIGFVNG
ncbi:MAG: AAA family ATPase [Clostridium sp.]|nr:AAA family ATPase [Clostridium sp.]MCM1171928.1 AAA family ATPase [Clostridium sp.]MCM1207904.1 AAA family ATPase [Ruminococcus sp.]